MATQQEIEHLAYELWEQEGRPHGRDWDHYYAAERILFNSGTAVEEKKPAAKAKSTARKTTAKATKPSTAKRTKAGE